MTQELINFKPNNDLELLLLEAAKDPNKRSEFWKKLLHSNVYVLGDQENETKLILSTWQSSNDEACGVFTSLEKVNEAMPKDTTYIRINAKVIFQSMVDSNLGTFVNPRFEPQFRLKVHDLKCLLNEEYSKVMGEKP